MIENSEILLVDSAQEGPDAEFSLACQEPYGGHSESQWRRAMAVAEDRLRFEKLLADLSATFVNLPSERLDEEIDSSLKTLVEFLGNDRSTLVKLVKDKKHVLVTHSYAVPGCEPFPLGSLADDRLPWFIGQFRGGNTVFLRRLPEDLPPEANTEKRYCQKHGITSNVTIPLKAGGSVLGAITFAFLQRQCDWPAEIIARLQLIGEVFANALQHKQADETLRAALAENEKLRRAPRTRESLSVASRSS